MLKYLFFLLSLVSCASAQTLLQFRAHIERYEGKSHFVYFDCFGNRTIGIGHKVTGFSIYMTDAQINETFDRDLDKAIAASYHLVPNPIKPKARVLLAALAFNLGEKGLSHFHNLIDNLKKQEYKGAAKSLHDSLWARQLPQRARDYVKILNGL